MRHATPPQRGSSTHAAAVARARSLRLCGVWRNADYRGVALEGVPATHQR